jgi:HAE1 family hydrophobic/amphiphilic exporter-1
MTTVLALVPLALGFGEGGEAQAPLARAIIGGLLSSALITLVFIPIVYSIFAYRLPKNDAQSGASQSVPSASDQDAMATRPALPDK